MSLFGFLGRGAAALAPAVIDALMSSGLPEEFITDATGNTKKQPAINAHRFQQLRAALQNKHKDPKKVAEELQKRFGARRSVQAMRTPSKLAGRAQTAMNLGFLAMMAAPFIPGLMGGGDEVDMQALMAGQGGMGSSPQDLQSLLGGLQQQAGGSYADTREDYYNMLGSNAARELTDVYNSDIPTAGIRSDLQTLIRGYEDQIGRMSSTEPTSLSQAFAMEGIYPSPNRMM
jgi:hypothetical protein